MITIDYNGRELDVWYDFVPGEPSVGLGATVDVYRVELGGRRIDRLLSYDTLGEIEDCVFDKLEKLR